MTTRRIRGSLGRAPVLSGSLRRSAPLLSPCERGRREGPADRGPRCELTPRAPYDAISLTLSKGAAGWPMQRDRGKCFLQMTPTRENR